MQKISIFSTIVEGSLKLIWMGSSDNLIFGSLLGAPIFRSLQDAYGWHNLSNHPETQDFFYSKNRSYAEIRRTFYKKIILLDLKK